MNERNIVAAILAVGVTQAQQQTGTSWPKAAEQAVSIYQLVLAELAKKQLPPAVGAQAGAIDSASASTPSARRGSANSATGEARPASSTVTG